MTARMIDGKMAAQDLRGNIARAADDLKAGHGLVPGLAVILVGSDPASQIYVGNKDRAAKEAGLQSWTYLLPADTHQDELSALIDRLNRDSTVHGILVQLPLPDHLNAQTAIQAIDPAKDVDGLHPENLGLLLSGRPGMVPCTPLGCMRLLRQVGVDLKGKRACVVGRSNIVGKPMAQLLLQADCTVTMAHSRTIDLADECRRADILIAAAGRPALIRGDWIRPGSIVIDVGINRIADAAGQKRITGDVAFDEALNRAGFITPVPGGVGPMTIACLLLNTLRAACLQKNLPVPAI